MLGLLGDDLEPEYQSLTNKSETFSFGNCVYPILEIRIGKKYRLPGVVVRNKLVVDAVSVQEPANIGAGSA